MSGRVTTVAIPVLQGAAELERLLPVIRAQALDGPIEMIVADSESTDGSAEVACRHGAEVIPVRRAEFSHGGTRNLLMERSHGELVAFLTQDALPAGDRWLAELTGAFSLRPDVGIAYGPGLPHRGASLTVRRELTAYFRSAADEDALAPVIVPPSTATLHGASSTTYFHSVNACIARAAWDEIPFRVIPYAEDRMLSLDMLRAGWAKAFVPRRPSSLTRLPAARSVPPLVRRMARTAGGDRSRRAARDRQRSAVDLRRSPRRPRVRRGGGRWLDAHSGPGGSRIVAARVFAVRRRRPRLPSEPAQARRAQAAIAGATRDVPSAAAA